MLPVTVDGAAAQDPCRRAEMPLACRERHGGARRDDGRDREAASLGHVAGQGREGTPGRGEPQVGVDEPAEQLGVVARPQGAGR